MFMRVDQLQANLPSPARADPNAAAALQELLGGKYGEMSTLGNYMFQSFNFRSKEKLKPFIAWWRASQPKNSATSNSLAMAWRC